MKQTDLAKLVGCSDPHLSLILSGDKRPSWGLAKRLAAATKTKPEIWMDGDIYRLQAVVRRAK